MPSAKVIAFCKSKQWWHADFDPKYRDVLLALGIDISSDFAQFYLHTEDGPTFYARHREIYQICWFSVYSDYAASLKSTREALRIPEPYIPLDAFEGEHGFFYNKATGQVLALGLGSTLQNFHAGNPRHPWQDFNAFIEWFFELTA